MEHASSVGRLCGKDSCPWFHQGRLAGRRHGYRAGVRVDDGAIRFDLSQMLSDTVQSQASEIHKPTTTNTSAKDLLANIANIYGVLGY